MVLVYALFIAWNSRYRGVLVELIILHVPYGLALYGKQFVRGVKRGGGQQGDGRWALSRS